MGQAAEKLPTPKNDEVIELEEKDIEEVEEVEDMTNEAVEIPEHPTEVKEMLAEVRKMNSPEELARIKEEKALEEEKASRKQARKKKDHENLLAAREHLFLKNREKIETEELQEHMESLKEGEEAPAPKKKSWLSKLLGK